MSAYTYSGTRWMEVECNGVFYFVLMKTEGWRSGPTYWEDADGEEEDREVYEVWDVTCEHTLECEAMEPIDMTSQYKDNKPFRDLIDGLAEVRV